jgi:hypothetical protein
VGARDGDPMGGRREPPRRDRMTVTTAIRAPHVHRLALYCHSARPGLVAGRLSRCTRRSATP